MVCPLGAVYHQVLKQRSIDSRMVHDVSGHKSVSNSIMYSLQISHTTCENGICRAMKEYSVLFPSKYEALFREYFTIIMVTLVVCWLVVELAVREHGDSYITAQRMGFALTWYAVITLAAVTDLHTY